MRVRYFADIRRLTGRDEETLPGSARTLRAVLVELGERHGAPLRARLFEGGSPERLSSAIILIVNGQNVVHLAGLDTPLGEDDVLAVFPMVAGG